MNENNWAGERIFLSVCLFLFFCSMFVVNPFTFEFMMAILEHENVIMLLFFLFFFCFFAAQTFSKRNILKASQTVYYDEKKVY